MAVAASTYATHQGHRPGRLSRARSSDQPLSIKSAINWVYMRISCVNRSRKALEQSSKTVIHPASSRPTTLAGPPSFGSMTLHH